MKTIAELESTAFLRQCNKIRHEAASLVQATEVLEIRKHLPVMDGTETTAEKNKKIEEQTKKNLNDIFDSLLETHAEETAKLLSLLIVPEEGDPAISGLELTMAGLEVLNNKKVMDFLSQLVRLGLKNMEE